MASNDLDPKKKMDLRTMIAKVADVLEHGKPTDPPAYTLILGAGASFGVVPTAKEMLGLPDSKNGIHKDCIPVWRARQRDDKVEIESEDSRRACAVEFWKNFAQSNHDHGLYFTDGLPSPADVAAAYKAVFETGSIGGLDSPERHHKYLSDVTLPQQGKGIQLNATHFYLASLLALQDRYGDIGSNKKVLYTGRRPFARTLFTTNFDPLLQTSLQLFQLLYYMTDRPEHLAADGLQTDHHKAIHLFYAHGSVHRPFMANTDDQIALLKRNNARDLAAYLSTHGVIVLGYSGWDDCLLEALNQTKTFANNLYWLARSSDSLTTKVKDFLATHSNAYWVQIDDGGSFMAQLHTRLCPGAPNTEILYNPIRPLLRQLECVNLSGIQTGVKEEEHTIGGEMNEESSSSLNAPQDVEQIRKQVIAVLEDAQKTFLHPTTEPPEWDELARQADLSYSNEDYGPALEAYSRLLSQYPDLPPDQKASALVSRGTCNRRFSNFTQAIEDYSACIELSQGMPDQLAYALYNRGFSFRALGQQDKAIDDYTRAISVVGVDLSTIALVLALRGHVYKSQKKIVEAIKDFTAVTQVKGADKSVIDSAAKQLSAIQTAS